MLKGSKEQLRRNALLEHMFGTMLTMQFLNLAAGFGAIDKRAALAMLDTVNADTARGLTQLRDEFVKGSGGDDMLVPIASRMRSILNDARERIEQASKPN